MKKYYILFFTLLFVSGCTTVLKLAYGIKKPKPRSISYIKKRIIKYELLSLPHYAIGEKGFYNLFNKLSPLNNTSVNQVIIFNKQGFLMLPKDTINCSGETINSISNYQDYLVIDSIEFKDLFCDSIVKLDGSGKYFSYPKGKYLFVFTWASYVGKLNEELTQNWVKSIDRLLVSDSIKGIYLNLDVQNNWKLNKKCP